MAEFGINVYDFGAKTDGAAALKSALTCAVSRGAGGRILIPAGDTAISETVVIGSPCIRVEGEVWAYNADPNGVFEARAGSKLRMKGSGFPALEIGNGNNAEGCQLYNFGIQGDIRGMDTRDSFSFSAPRGNAGVLFARSRVDQGELRKLSFCGLGAGVCAEKDAEIDACRITDCNFDGCGVGVYFAPRASYYSRISACVIADNPYFGLFVDGKERKIANFEVTDTHFVRNGGAFADGGCAGYPDDVPFAAVCFRGVSGALFRGDLIDCPGTFWYYSPDAVSNRERQISTRKTVGLYIEGDCNRVVGNTFRRSTCASAVIRGNGNVLMCNTADGDVEIDGRANVVRDLVFTTPEARLILRTPDALDAEQSNVPESRVTVL